MGGRTLTEPVATDNGPRPVDLGGQWIGRTQYHVLGMLRRFGLTLFPQVPRRCSVPTPTSVFVFTNGG